MYMHPAAEPPVLPPITAAVARAVTVVKFFPSTAENVVQMFSLTV